MKKIYLKFVFTLVLLVFIVIDASAQTSPDIRSISGTFTVPAGITRITVECWGGGGRGATVGTQGGGSYKADGGGGGGGAYSRKVIDVTPGEQFSFVVGAGSSTENPGGDSWFWNQTTVLAKGGASATLDSPFGALGGSAGNSIGDIKYSGGNGGDTAQNDKGGGGGSSAGTSANGTNGTLILGATAPAGGGNGGDGSNSENKDGKDGFAPGGGGGGASKNGSSPKTGGNGGNGRVVISWCSPPNTPGPISGVVSQCPGVTSQVYTISPVSGSTSYNWTVPEGWTITSGQGTTSITVTTGAAGQNGDITVSARGDCGRSVNSQILPVTAASLDLSASLGTLTGCYPTVKAAFDKINDGTHRGNIVIKVNANTTETATAVLNASGTGSASYTAITMFPTTTGRSISGSINGQLIDLNGADYVTIDGSVNGTGSDKSLTVSNTNTGTSANTIRFINDATNNILRNCIVEGSSTGTSTGTVFFSTTAGTGNSNNTVSGNDIKQAGANLPVNAVFSLGTAAKDNSSNSINNNNLSDYFSPTIASNGVFLSSNNTAWTVSGNRFFQTATRNTTATSIIHRAIQITSGNNHTVANNIIGFANAGQTGTMTYTSGGTTTPLFRGIELNVGTSTASGIQGNTIRGISFSTSSSSNSDAGIFTGISVLGGAVNIGTVTGNTIGNDTDTDSIMVTSTVTGGLINGIYAASAGNVQIQNNKIGSISTNSGIAIGHVIQGIQIAGTGNFTISDNVVGSLTTSNSIKVGNDATTTGVCTFVGISSASTGANTITRNTIQNVITNGTGTSTIQGINAIGASPNVSITNNSILSFRNKGTGIMRGIYNSGASSIVTISSNTIANHAVSTATGAFTGILTDTGAVTTELNVNNNKLGDSERNLVNYEVANSGTLTGISTQTTASTCRVEIKSNDIRRINYSAAGTHAQTYISNITVAASHEVSDNTFNNLNVNTSGDVTFIVNSSPMPVNGIQNVKNNRIVTAFNKASGGGVVTGITSTANTNNSGVKSNFEDNIISNITVTGATTISGIVNTDTGTGSPVKTIRGNVLSNWSGGTGTVTAMSVNITSVNNETRNNMIHTINTSGIVTGIATASGNDNIFQNAIHTLTSIGGVSTAIQGIAVSGSGSLKNIYNNTIYNISGNSTVSGSVNGIIVSGGNTVNVYQNTVYGLLGNSLTTGSINGISITGGNNISAFRNKIYDLSSSSSGITTGFISGISVSEATANLATSIRNNIIGGLKATAASGTNVIRGINVINTGANSSANVYYNTVYINASTSGANFGTSGVFHAASTTSTTATLDLRNNIILNTSVAKGIGTTVAYRRSSGTANMLSNYAATSNNNLFYAGTPGAQNLIYSDGTSSSQSLSGYQNGVFTAGTVAGRDNRSVTEDMITDLRFLTLTESDIDYLHLNPNKFSIVESRGAPISGVTVDYDGDLRQGNIGYIGTGFAPDIGADEFEGILPDVIWDGGALTTLWNDALNWNFDFVPGAIHNVILSGSDVINVNTTGQTKNLTINNSNLVLTVKSGNSLTVNGNLLMNSGTLNTETNFPVVSGNITLNAGTVGYTGSGNQTIAGQSYFHLTLNGGGTKTIASSVKDIHGNLNIKGNAVGNLQSLMTIDGNLDIEDSGSLVIASDRTLKVNGAINNTSGINGLVLKSDASGTASLIHNTDDVPATVERFISGPTEGWHFLSAPVSNQEISGSWLPSGTYGNGTGYDLYLWNEPTYCWVYKNNLSAETGWGSYHSGNIFSVGRGYLYSVQAENPTKEFKGNLNNGAIDYTLTSTNYTDSSLSGKEGFNLLGNPYPSSIDWRATSGWSRTNLEETAGGYDMWIWNPSADNLAGNYGVYNSETDEGTLGVNRYIAPMQGFFVKAVNAGSISMNNSVRSNNGAGNWFRNPNPESRLMRVLVSSEIGNSADEILMHFGATQNANGALKLFSHLPKSPSLYMPSGKDSYTVRYFTNTAENKSVPVAFKAGVDGNYKLQFKFDESKFDFVLLEDRLLKFTRPVTAGSIYKFKSITGDNVDRFVLHFAPITKTSDNELPIRVYADENYLNVDLTNVNVATEIEIFDIAGRLLMKQNLKGATMHQLDLNTSNQIILVRLFNENGQFVRKVFWSKIQK